MTEILSPLAKQLEELIQSGLVPAAPVSSNDFPSARVVVPVYDSTGTFMSNPEKQANPYAELARYSR